MATPNRLGMQKSYIPNSEADMRFKKKVYQRGREIAERDPYELHDRREMKRLRRLKANENRSD